MHALYERQGAENSGWVEPALPTAAAGAGADFDRLQQEAHSVWVERQIVSAGTAAQRAGVRGTPSFDLGPTGGPPRARE